MPATQIHSTNTMKVSTNAHQPSPHPDKDIHDMTEDIDDIDDIDIIDVSDDIEVIDVSDTDEDWSRMPHQPTRREILERWGETESEYDDHASARSL
jgi:hypothetical protein